MPTLVFAAFNEVQTEPEEERKKEGVKIKYIIQKVNSIIMLPDGVGYKSKGLSNEKMIK